MKLSLSICAVALFSHVAQGQVVLDVAKDPKLSAGLVIESDKETFVTSDAKNIDFVHGNDGDGIQTNLRGANKDDLGAACKEEGTVCKSAKDDPLCCSGLVCIEDMCEQSQ
jgi:hypothetical protein